MTCEHCQKSVMEEVLQVEGVRAVDVDLENGTLTVAGEAFEDADVRGAVDGAGYTFIG